jgi:hypothetical protein
LHHSTHSAGFRLQLDDCKGVWQLEALRAGVQDVVRAVLQYNHNGLDGVAVSQSFVVRLDVHDQHLRSSLLYKALGFSADVSAKSVFPNAPSVTLDRSQLCS